jgi:hypothetical protein
MPEHWTSRLGEDITEGVNDETSIIWLPRNASHEFIFSLSRAIYSLIDYSMASNLHNSFQVSVENREHLLDVKGEALSQAFVFIFSQSLLLPVLRKNSFKLDISPAHPATIICK